MSAAIPAAARPLAATAQAERQPARPGATGVWLVLVAAGRGERFGKPYNKVFHKLHGRSILSRTLDALERCRAFEGAVLVIAREDEAAYRALTAQEGACPLVRRLEYGGETRQASVRRGLAATPERAALVAVHDAARPFVEPALVRLVLAGARQYGAAIPGRPIYDTVKLVDDEGVTVSTLPRERLFAVQTPQAFDRAKLLLAHERAAADGFVGTDDAALYERYVGEVRIVSCPECEQNIKITTPSDVTGPSAALPRVGMGYDAHRLVEGRPLILGGVEVPHEKGLLGHSDADVALHALMDALLGAAGMGDIGRHFPDHDKAYLNISSLALLAQVMRKLAEAGLCAGNVDVSIVAQRPRLKEYLPQMNEAVARVLDLPATRVNFKATTSEGMGFEGRGEGISAHAVATLYPWAPKGWSE